MLIAALDLAEAGDPEGSNITDFWLLCPIFSALTPILVRRWLRRSRQTYRYTCTVLRRLIPWQ